MTKLTRHQRAALSLAAVLGGMMIIPQFAGAAESSTTKIVQAVRYPSADYYSVIAKLTPAHPDAQMKFKLLKKATKTSDWQKVDSATESQWTEDGGDSLFRTEGLGVVQGARCKVVASFPGDSDHSASRNAVSFSCKDGGGSY